MELQLTVSKRRRLSIWLRERFQSRLDFDSAVWRLSAAFLLLFSSAAMMAVALGIPTGFGAIIDVGALILLNAIALYIAAQLIAMILSMLYLPVPRLFIGFFIYVAVESYLILYYSEIGFLGSLILGIAYAIVGANLGLGIGVLWRYRRSRGAKWAGAAGAAITVVVMTGMAGTFNSQDDPVFDYSTLDGAAAMDVNNPGEPGDYSYRNFSYGSGTDRHREQFADEAELLSSSVDASAYITKWPWLKKLFWGFEEEELPLNGQVWMPEGEGPFPLVLMVHGNHLMEQFSDDGYDYLGELLASRGFIAVSVDENFMNYSVWSGIPNDDMKVRAWLLLKHVQQIQTFSQLSDSAFYGRVDFSNIALIGHSRGGQAVAMAADYDKWFHEDISLASLKNTSIKTVIALAPTDRQVDSKSAKLTNVNYLTLQGARDGDVNSFYGDRQYLRSSFTQTSDSLYRKASLYIAEANHSRFNTEWGTMDERPPGGLFLNQAGMLEEEEQQQIAQVYVSAFLETTLNGAEEYAPLFKDYRAGLEWLPQSTAYVSRYEDSTFQAAARFQEDQNMLTLPHGGTVEAEGFTEWKEAEAKDRDDKNKGTKGAVLEWEGTASYKLTLPESYTESIAEDGADILAFSMANLEDELAEDSAPIEQIIDQPKIDIELTTEQGDSVRLPLTEFMPVPEPFRTTFTIIPWLEKRVKDGKYKEDVEPVFQTYRLPLETFAEASDQFDEASVSQITFHFEEGPGKIMLDDIGFSQ